jgi:hypothetical protein
LFAGAHFSVRYRTESALGVEGKSRGAASFYAEHLLFLIDEASGIPEETSNDMRPREILIDALVSAPGSMTAANAGPAGESDQCRGGCSDPR